MGMYSGDEEVSDAESVDDDSNPEYDHDFEAEVICQNCGNDDSGCECDDDESDLQDQDECVICGEGADDLIHQEEA
jgi:hypothetical protein